MILIGARGACSPTQALLPAGRLERMSTTQPEGFVGWCWTLKVDARRWMIFEFAVL